MTHRLATNYAKNYCNRTPIVEVIVENVVTFFLGHGVFLSVTAYIIVPLCGVSNVIIKRIYVCMYLVLIHKHC